ncbi:prepilin peptidase [Methylorubrum rhodesianum]|jgi:prepilin peptidase CpaA|uniref:Prepilin peptidase n=1 Tax=Methylorubrum rhodesianum TaxID=29427 RepID=A0ABU9ZCP8_9HYPH|nr:MULTISPECIES: prepilin peptidase [Methylorubrum]MBB5762063.1 prepilin peptidase CpaA [Methylorubrum rhodesianum]MBI1690456.1 peptidase [Methylorubrum sp. DB1722]MBK3406711.1 prepilin peptidase [Methylorubrum rhodesianum]MBY0140857.1 prepilin peptidase [Methylorubrum populi]
MASYLLLCVVFPFLMAYAAASDLLTMRISNRITGLVLAGFVLYAFASGMTWDDLVWHLAAGVLTLVITFAFFARGWIGGGDAKLAAATALWIGLAHLPEYLVVASILGGPLTLSIVSARKYPLPKLAHKFPFAVHLHDTKTGVPYGIALAAAALLVLPNAVGLEQLAWP